MNGNPEIDANLGRVFGGNFRIDAAIGRGAMGVVYRGVQLSVDRAVAIKLIHASFTANASELVKRFQREAEATARLTHENSVRLYDFGVTDAFEFYMVMELLQGSDLAARLDAARELPLLEVLHVAREILNSLAEAHALGIVHRDLKPSNVFLARAHAGRVVTKVMDFGIAGMEQAPEDTRLTKTGAVLGSPAYMSPEQARGLPVDLRSDLYSLGVMLFELLTGRLPFEAPTAMGMLLAHVTTPPPRLSEIGASFPELLAVQALLDALLAKEPRHRPVNAEAVLAMIDTLVKRLEPTRTSHDPPDGAEASRESEPAPAPADTAPRRWWLHGIVVSLGLLVATWLHAAASLSNEKPRAQPEEAGLAEPPSPLRETTTKVHAEEPAVQTTPNQPGDAPPAPTLRAEASPEATSKRTARPETVELDALSRKPLPPEGLDTTLQRYFPERARATGHSGSATLKLTILSDGRVGQMTVARETGDHGFGRACMQALKPTRWQPPLDQRGRPVATVIDFACEFEVSY